jgi:hypothetical protein
MITLDIIGTIYEPSPEGEAPTQLTGWHVNTTVDDLALHPELLPHVVTPTSLRRVWAGDDPMAPIITVALRFADEAEAESILSSL